MAGPVGFPFVLVQRLFKVSGLSHLERALVCMNGATLEEAEGIFSF